MRVSWKKEITGDAYWLAGWSRGDPQAGLLFGWGTPYDSIFFSLDCSISTDKDPSLFCLGVIQLAVGVLETGRKILPFNVYRDFHLLSPFSALYLIPSFHYACALSLEPLWFNFQEIKPLVKVGSRVVFSYLGWKKGLLVLILPSAILLIFIHQPHLYFP